MKMYGGVEVWLLAFLMSALDRAQIVSFMPSPLQPQGVSSQYPLDRRLGGPQSQSGHSGEEKMPLPVFESQLFSP
jgi:hypothetical protein